MPTSDGPVLLLSLFLAGTACTRQDPDESTSGDVAGDAGVDDAGVDTGADDGVPEAPELGVSGTFYTRNSGDYDVGYGLSWQERGTDEQWIVLANYAVDCSDLGGLYIPGRSGEFDVVFPVQGVSEDDTRGAWSWVRSLGGSTSRETRRGLVTDVEIEWDGDVLGGAARVEDEDDSENRGSFDFVVERCGEAKAHY